MGSCRSALSSDHKLTYYGCLRFPPTFINNRCKVFAPSHGHSEDGRDTPPTPSPVAAAAAVSPSGFTLQKSFKKKKEILRSAPQEAGTGSSARAFNQARRQSLAVLDNSVWLVHTAALDLKPDPRRRTEVTKGGRGEAGGEGWGGRGDGVAFRLPLRSVVKKRKTFLLIIWRRCRGRPLRRAGAHAAHAFWCVARPPQLPAVSPPTVWTWGWVEGARGEKAG